MDQFKLEYLTFKCSAACGDIIYTLPSVKHICEQTGKKAIYYIDNVTYRKRQSVDTYQALKLLLESQDYILQCKAWRGQAYDYNFDSFRRLKYINTPMPLIMAKSIGLNDVDYSNPWLCADDHYNDKVFFNVTDRYKNYSFSFQDKAKSMAKKPYFLGLRKEFLNSGLSEYCNFVPNISNLYEVFLCLWDCAELYCNQSAILTIAQGMNLSRIYLAKDRDYTNTVLNKEILL